MRHSEGEENSLRSKDTTDLFSVYVSPHSWVFWYLRTIISAVTALLSGQCGQPQYVPLEGREPIVSQYWKKLKSFQMADNPPSCRYPYIPILHKLSSQCTAAPPDILTESPIMIPYRLLFPDMATLPFGT